MPLNQPKVAAIIPARYNSTRFPGKALVEISGKPMIQWVYETTLASKVSKTIVATDDKRIHECVISFGGDSIMTFSEHKTGTDRVAEVARGMEIDLVINVQGDEPLLPTSVINDLIDNMSIITNAEMGTVAVPIHPGSSEIQDPNVVKVVLDNKSFALYFSRSPIPFTRDPENANSQIFKHWGIYAYKKQFLDQFVTWLPSSLECAEKLEQLRALENGAKISVCIVSGESVGVDTPGDVKKVEDILKRGDRFNS